MQTSIVPTIASVTVSNSEVSPVFRHNSHSGYTRGKWQKACKAIFSKPMSHFCESGKSAKLHLNTMSLRYSQFPINRQVNKN